ncbi:MAG: purine-nucleoside phosphorylase [Candidatus Eisenbacteria bacterium]|nr:purine-nucleoside phosphorylase [Candidatus Eisenbacteria bacterium]
MSGDPGRKREECLGRLEAAARVVLERLGPLPANAVVLGSGLGPLADGMSERVALPVSGIPGHPRPGVQGHAGLWVKGRLEDVPVLALQGRAHFYEGHTMEEVTFATMLLKRLGVERLLVTNAAGAVSPRFKPGDLVLLDGAINLMLHQPRWDHRSPRSMPLDPGLMRIAERVAGRKGIALRRGALAAFTGPSYETPAEVRMACALGGDAGGMSTVPEIYAAGQAGLRVLGITCITNFGSGISASPLDHREVMETADRVASRFRDLVGGILAAFDREQP